MPSAGQSMTEGRIVVWLKKEGETVEKGEPLLEIETDKANLEVEALHSGVLRKIFHAEGETCAVLSPLAVIGDAAEEIDFEAIRKEATAQAAAAAVEEAAPPAAAPPPPEPVPSPPAEATTAPAARSATAGDNGTPALAASPAARALSAASDVALGRLRGSGPRGRILRRDVEAAAATAGQAGSSVGPAGILAERPPYAPASPQPPSRVEITGMRGAIARALQASKQTIPHFYETIAIDVTATLALREQKRQAGIKLSVNDFIVRATALALADEPRVNCRVFDGHIEYPPAVNVGIAVAVDDGLVVPVIVGAEGRDLEGLATESRRIVEAARQGKLIGSGQGTFTISNLGMFGIESFSAIINPPEGAILAVGEARTEAVAFAGGFVPRSMMRLTISCDHRAIDGALAARFLVRVRSLLEDPTRL